ncbi:MAG: hypothetical protein GY861_17920 [bacterium]|nr:hypothetical protein [bacterium]
MKIKLKADAPVRARKNGMHLGENLITTEGVECTFKNKEQEKKLLNSKQFEVYCELCCDEKPVKKKVSRKKAEQDS